MKSKKTKDRSLYENSMKVVANLVKMSSFYLAKTSLGTAEKDPVEPRKLQTAKSFVMVANNPVSRSQEPVTNSKKVSYLVEPDEGYRSSYDFQEDMNVDGKASDYIRKVHEKNQKDLFLIPELS